MSGLSPHGLRLSEVTFLLLFVLLFMNLFDVEFNQLTHLRHKSRFRTIKYISIETRASHHLTSSIS